MKRFATAMLVAGVVLAGEIRAWQAPRAQTPTFRASTELTALDVTVVDADGQPIANLEPADFTVKVDGKPRRVARVEWIQLARPSTSLPPPPQPDGYSTNENSRGGRLFVIAIDQPNIRPDGVLGIRSAIEAFIDSLEPADRIAAVALGGGISTAFTTSRSTVKEAIARMSGEMRPITEIGSYSLSASEALDIADGNQAVIQSVIGRECVRLAARTDPVCAGQILSDAEAMASTLRQETDRTMLALHGLLDGLRAIDAPKTLVLVSEGFAVGSQSGSVLAVGSLAAAARTSVYALKPSDRFFDVTGKRPPALAGDRQLRFAGLDLLSTASKGGVFEIGGASDTAFRRLERELSGYYLVGVESTPADADGKAHPISVQVGRRGAVVRARRELSNAAATRAGAPNPIEAVAAALSLPLDMTALPLHVATFSLRDQDVSKIQVLIHADIGSDYTAAKAVSLGYAIADNAGTIVVHQIGDGRLAPPGTSPAPLGYTVSASLAPGEYTLKLAVSESGRVGSIEHPIHAGLIDAGPLKLSELMIGGPADTKELLRPSISYDVNHGGVQGYMEAYGSAGNLLMRYEVAPTLDAPSVLSAVVPGKATADGRTVFSYILPLRDLAAGQYYLRATLSAQAGATDAAGTGPLKKVARGFRLVPTPPGAAAAAAPAAAPAPAPAVATVAVRLFKREEATEAATLQRFRETVAPAGSKDFDDGVGFLTAGDFVKAEEKFKTALRLGSSSGNSTAPLTYLAATYAASGHDREAANVWQNALIDGSEHPQIFEWLAETFVRIREFSQARSILEEAIAKWPKDTRFSERLAALPPAANGR